MTPTFDYVLELWDRAVPIWVAGGWAMPPIGVIAFAMFGMGVHVLLSLRSTGFLSVPERRWRTWVDQPAEGSGPTGDLIRRCMGATTLSAAAEAFDDVRSAQQGAFERDLRVMKVCVSAAPLVGLLGTVTGMLATFNALATGSGGEKTMSMIAAGISEALITTEAGLVVALPGLFFQTYLSRKYENYKVSLAHMETVCTASLYRRIQNRPPSANAARSTSSTVGAIG
jgi:biopolymer transport protein ExbB